MRELSSNGTVVAMVINASGPTSVPNGHGQLVLVALGHSGAMHTASVPTRRWEVTITNLGRETVAVEAWIERRDVPGELLGYRPQYGFAEDTPFDIVKTGSLGSLATGQRSIAVGAIEFDKVRCSYDIADYSSRRGWGPTTGLRCTPSADGHREGSSAAPPRAWPARRSPRLR